MYACLVLLVSIDVEIKFAMYMYSSCDDISIIDYRAMSGPKSLRGKQEEELD